MRYLFILIAFCVCLSLYAQEDAMRQSVKLVNGANLVSIETSTSFDEREVMNSFSVMSEILASLAGDGWRLISQQELDPEYAILSYKEICTINISVESGEVWLYFWPSYYGGVNYELLSSKLSSVFGGETDWQFLLNNNTRQEDLNVIKKAVGILAQQ